MAHEDVIAQIAEPVGVTECVKCKQPLDVSGQPFFAPIECPHCHTHQFVPARIGHFLLLELLGKGGMAGVYRAVDETLGRQVAIKVMRRELGEDPKFIETFLREARAAAQLNHRNIVSIYSFGEQKGQPYIVMELLDGGRFDQLIAKQKVVDEVRALEIALDVAEGLKAAGDIGLIHGDIKPANILFDRNGTAKVADFGLARFQKTKTRQGEIWGTPYYIAPEKVRQQKEDIRSDIYSLGATLYHALGGKPPFEGETATDVVLARLNEPPKQLSDIRPGIHPRTVEVIGRMLENDPFRRYPNYASLISDLRSTLREVRGGASKDAKAAAKSAGAKKKARPIVAIAAGVIVLIAATVIFLVLRHNASKRETPPLVPPPPIADGVKPPDGGVSPSPPPPAETLLPVQPFSAQEQNAIAAAAAELAKSRGALVDSLWADMIRALPPEHPGRPWGQLFYALAPWFSNNEEEFQRRLKPLSEREFAAQPGDIPHPGVLPRAVARFILGQPFELPPAGPGRAWPAWFDAFMNFIRAYDSFRAGRTEEGALFLKKYLDAPVPDDPKWPFAFRSVAETWRKRVEEWARYQAQIENRLRAGQHEAVLNDLEKWRGDVNAGRFMPGLETRLAQVREALAQRQAAAEEARRIAAEKARKEQVQAELDRLDAAREQLLPRIARRDFRGAIESLRADFGGLTTDEAKQALAITVETLEGMDALRLFVIRSIASAPYTGARRELGGDITAAAAQRLTVVLASGAGVAERTWDQVPSRVFADMAAFYIGRSSAPAPERAELGLALAMFAYYTGAFRPAENYAESAIRLNPEIRAKARRWMPGLLAEP